MKIQKNAQVHFNGAYAKPGVRGYIHDQHFLVQNQLCKIGSKLTEKTTK